MNDVCDELENLKVLARLVHDADYLDKKSYVAAVYLLCSYTESTAEKAEKALESAIYNR